MYWIRSVFSHWSARNCHIRTPGWFAPGVAATVQQRSDGYYLIPGKRDQVQVNSKPVTAAVKLQDNDSLAVRGLTLRYNFRPIKLT